MPSHPLKSLKSPQSRLRNSGGKFRPLPLKKIQLIQEEIAILIANQDPRVILLSPSPRRWRATPPKVSPKWELRRKEWLDLTGKCVYVTGFHQRQNYQDFLSSPMKDRRILLGLWELREGKKIPQGRQIVQFCQTKNCLNPGHYLLSREEEGRIISLLPFSFSLPISQLGEPHHEV